MIGSRDFSIAPFLPTAISPMDGVKAGAGKTLAMPVLLGSAAVGAVGASAVRAAVGYTVKNSRLPSAGHALEGQAGTHGKTGAGRSWLTALLSPV